MELDVRINNRSMAVTIEDPFRLDLDLIMGKVDEFLASQGAALNGLDIRGLLPRMVKGIAGCEAGCPADAKGVVSQGFQSFQLEYIEGGILSARAATADGKELTIRIFPEF